MGSFISAAETVTKRPKMDSSRGEAEFSSHWSSNVLDPFVPTPDVRSRHWTLVRAPAEFVHEVARNFDMQSVPAVHAIFWLHVLVDQPGRAYAAGAACQPWQADVVFSPIETGDFAEFADPDRVKIAWSIETEPIELALTRLSTETRVVATDEHSRARFRRYWRLFGIGIVGIRWLLLPALRRDAEWRWGARGNR